MKRFILKPEGWLCQLKECPPGFFIYNNSLCFKTEYKPEEVYCESGEIFWGGTTKDEMRQILDVQPVVAHWEQFEL